MTKPRLVNVNIPFDGFYESRYSAEIDYQAESFIQYRCEEGEAGDRDYEPFWPEAIQLTSEEYGSILFDVTSYDIAYAALARNYVDAFNYVAGQAFGMSVKDKRQRYDVQSKDWIFEPYNRPSIRLAFEAIKSPREYNFETDRIFADVPISVMRELFKRSQAEKHATLINVIRRRFTSRSGFISFYSSDIREWLQKPLGDWDHNELGTLLIAAMTMAGADVDSDETRDELQSMTIGDDGGYQEWESAVDWPKFESKRLELRAEKLAEWIVEEPESAMAWRANHLADFDSIVTADPSAFSNIGLDELLDGAPYRCPLTADLFEPHTI